MRYVLAVIVSLGAIFFSTVYVVTTFNGMRLEVARETTRQVQIEQSHETERTRIRETEQTNRLRIQENASTNRLAMSYGYGLTVMVVAISIVMAGLLALFILDHHYSRDRGRYY